MGKSTTNLGVIVERRYLSQHMPRAAVTELQARGYSLDLISPDDGYFAVDSGIFTDANGQRFMLHDYDVVVSRNRNALGLVLLRYAEEAGIAVINTHTAVQKVRNKAEMAVALALANIRAAPTVLSGTTETLADRLDGRFPLILKATYGDNGQGLRVVHHRNELSELSWISDVVLAQHYLPNDSYDLKLYVCGEQVFAVRKPSPLNGDPKAPSVSVATTTELAALARKCGQVFGLDLYGVDCIETEAGPVVIEVNDFPNYTAIPGIAELVADQVLMRAEQKRGGR
jgi:glutathione synthase/RimK-type ligase-like ATP-grasp enzyme